MVKSLLTAVALAALALPGEAFAANLFVSGKGANAAGCGPATRPCRTFQYAHDLAPPDSQIAVLDSGDYGPLVINKSISVVNDGAGVAGVTYTGGDAAIAIRAGVADKVVLRGLTVNGERKGAIGLNLTSAGAVDIEKCAFNNFVFVGATLAPVGRSTTEINVVKSEFSGNRVGLQAYGVNTRKVSITDSQINLNFDYGLTLGPGNLGSSFVVSGGRMFGNGNGIFYYGSSTGNTFALSDVTISGAQGTGILYSSGALTVHGSTVSENSTDIQGPSPSAGTITSAGDNTMFPTVTGNLTIVRAPLK